MGTNFPHPIASEIQMADVAREDGLGERVMAWLRQRLCGLHGHDTMLQFEQDRLSLQCVSCGHKTPGWSLNEPPPTVTVRGDARRHRLRPQLISARKIA